jgi:hypothetical protein
MIVDQDIIDYYVNQVGGSGGIYGGVLYQRGQGIGGFLSGLFRSVLPILRKRGLAVTKTLFNTGVDMLGDMQNNVSLKDSFNNRKGETLTKLKSTVITGNGYKNTRKRKLNHLPSTSRVNNISVKKQKKRKKTNKKQKISSKNKFKDIFCLQ